MRHFEGGATRDDDTGKIDYEGFLSPLVLKRFGEYMRKHQQTAEGERGSDNWQAGIDRDTYMKSLLRHVHDVWMEHDGYDSRDGLEDALCAVLFNTMGYLFEVLREQQSSEFVAFTVEWLGDGALLWNGKPVGTLNNVTLTTSLPLCHWCSSCKYLTDGPMCRGCHYDTTDGNAPSHWAVERTN